MTLSAKTVDNLVLTLNGSMNMEDKQTKIAAAKCLYHASKYMSIPVESLSQMLELINDDTFDVSVYMQATYLCGCAKVACASDKQLDHIHLDNISSLYAAESLKLGDNDYAPEINQVRSFETEKSRQSSIVLNTIYVFSESLRDVAVRGE